MRAFIERVFKSKKLKTEKKDTEAIVESIIEEVKEVIIKELKQGEVVTYSKPKHFPDCNCFKCVRWRQQNAK
jgi:hypothetical protein